MTISVGSLMKVCGKMRGSRSWCLYVRLVLGRKKIYRRGLFVSMLEDILIHVSPAVCLYLLVVCLLAHCTWEL